MLNNLTLSDLIALRDYCFDESLGFYPVGEDGNMIPKEDLKWHDRHDQCDKELSERVEKIFEKTKS